jgi:hypothetical protein
MVMVVINNRADLLTPLPEINFARVVCCVLCVVCCVLCVLSKGPETGFWKGEKSGILADVQSVGQMSHIFLNVPPMHVISCDIVPSYYARHN